MKILIKLSLLTMAFVSNAAQKDVCETKRDIFIDNSQTKVWQTTICPSQPLGFHTHQTSRVVTAKDDVKLLVKYQSGKQHVIDLKAGVPIFLSQEQGMEPHQDVNLSGKPIKVTVVELKNSPQ